MSEKKLDPVKRKDEEYLMGVILKMAQESLDPNLYSFFCIAWERMAITRNLHLPELTKGEPAAQQEWVNIPLYLRRASELSTDEVEQLQTQMSMIMSWCQAYPLDLFPEPDLEAAADCLMGYGMSLDSISASSMRHVLEGVQKIIAD